MVTTCRRAKDKGETEHTTIKTKIKTKTKKPHYFTKAGRNTRKKKQQEKKNSNRYELVMPSY